MIVEINNHRTALLVINKSVGPITIVASVLFSEWDGKGCYYATALFGPVPARFQIEFSSF
jgi:hypothetical protein